MVQKSPLGFEACVTVSVDGFELMWRGLTFDGEFFTRLEIRCCIGPSQLSFYGSSDDLCGLRGRERGVVLGGSERGLMRRV